MNASVLIDAIVRQTMVLIAQLATTAGLRAPLAHTANQVFLDLVRELKDQGLGNKVIADMFGLALRTYHSKVQRLSESSTFHGRSLWEAVLEHLQDAEGTVLQADVLLKFSRDDEAMVRGVLADLADSGLVFRTGRGSAIAYRAAKDEERTRSASTGDADALANLVYVAAHRIGSATVEDILEAVPADRTAVEEALASLVREERVVRLESEGAPVKYRAESCVLALGDPAGWEAAVFDHYQAVVAAICTKLRRGGVRAEGRDEVGGSTYGFTIWQGHPHEAEVRGLLAKLRNEVAALREKVASYNEDHAAPARVSGVIAYLGQYLLEDEEGGTV